MKILLLTSKSPWPPRDGGAAATLSLVDILLLNNFQVSILSFNTLKHYSVPQNIPKYYSERIRTKFITLDNRIRPAPLLSNLLFSRNSFIKERFYSGDYLKALVEWLNEDFNIIQAEGLSMAQYLPAVKSSSKAVIIYRPHNVESKIWSMLADEEPNLLIKKYFRVLSQRLRKEEAAAAEFSDAVIPMAVNDMEWFSKYCKGKPLTVIPPAFNLPEIQKTNTVPRSVAFIGSLDWLPNIKGLKWFVDKVWPEVVKKVPDAVLRIAGRNPGKLKLKHKNINFEGETESSHKFLCTSRIMIVPLFSGSGIRIRIIEGMLLGRCIIATPIAAAGIKCNDGENILIAGNPDIFADRIIRCLTDEEYTDYLSANALKSANENYSIFETAKQAAEFYNSLI